MDISQIYTVRRQHMDTFDEVGGAEFARRYRFDDFDGPLARQTPHVTVVTSRQDGVHFFAEEGLTDLSRVPLQYLGSYSPMVGQITMSESSPGEFEYQEFSSAWRFWVAVAGCVLAGILFGLFGMTVLGLFLYGTARLAYLWTSFIAPVTGLPRCCTVRESHYERACMGKNAFGDGVARKCRLLSGHVRPYITTGLLLTWLLICIVGRGGPGTFDFATVAHATAIAFITAAVLFGTWYTLKAVTCGAENNFHRLTQIVLFLVLALACFYSWLYFDPRTRLAMEGQTSDTNVFAVAAICAGSEQVLPWFPSAWSFNAGHDLFGWGPCPHMDGVMTPTIFLFDLAQLSNWTNPTPTHAIPLHGWDAAMHIEAFVVPYDPSNADFAIPEHMVQEAGGSLEVLWITATSGFAQRFLGVLGIGSGKVLAVPVAYRQMTSVEPLQFCSSFQQGEELGFQRGNWIINVTSAVDPEVQYKYTAACPNAAYLQGGMVYMSEDRHGQHVFLLTAGVESRDLWVIDFSVSIKGQGGPAVRLHQPYADPSARLLEGRAENIYSAFPSDNDTERSWQQLVGRTFLADTGHVYGVAADFSDPGGVVIFDLSTEPQAPRRTGASIHEETPQANRVVLVQDQMHGPKVVWAVVPYEGSRRFGVYDVTNATRPCLVALSEEFFSSGRTYCLEVFPTQGILSTKVRVVIMSDDGAMATSEEFDLSKLSAQPGPGACSAS